MATENDSLTNSVTASLTSAMHRLMLDPDLADLTVTCGDKKWKVHSNILAVRSPFFKAAITNNMVEKLKMKIDIKEFDPNAMEEVLNFMYGVPKENGPVKFLFEAAERFQMEDLKEYAVKIARKEMTAANVVGFGHAAELYGCEEFLAECAKFILKNDVPLTDEDMSPKLALMIVSILRYDNQKLIDANLKLKRKLGQCENDLKDEKEWRWLTENEWRRLTKNLYGLLVLLAIALLLIVLVILLLAARGGSGYYDKGMTKAKTPLSTSNRYIEIEIIDTLQPCYMRTIGYHADDGKVYMCTEKEDPFGPHCKKGDFISCDYECKSDSEDEEEADPHNRKMVHVYYTRSGKLIWKKEEVRPKGGFSPFLGIKNCQEKISGLQTRL